MTERRNLTGTARKARALRVAATDVETRLWFLIRNRQLAGAKFRRQVPIGRYFADSACTEARLVVELDGSQHAEQTAYDERRTRSLESLGWRVLRIWNNEILLNPSGVADAILDGLADAPRPEASAIVEAPKPLPSPSGEVERAKPSG